MATGSCETQADDCERRGLRDGGGRFDPALVAYVGPEQTLVAEACENEGFGIVTEDDHRVVVVVVELRYAIEKRVAAGNARTILMRLRTAR
jgi:hypothetical protein